MPKTKKNIKVRDLKPTKDAKGGGGFKQQGTGKGSDGTGKGNTGANTGANMGANTGTGMN